MVRDIVQTAVRAIYPAECLTCRAPVETDFGLCGTCWRETPFLGNAVCDQCGVPQPAGEPDDHILCDDCLAAPRAWSRGRAALLYRENGRRLVLGLKHGDRQDLVGPASGWMAQAATPMLRPDMLIAPVPLHWTRMIKRRYNQSGLLAQALGARLGLPVCFDLLKRVRRTRRLDGMSAEMRRDVLDNAITVSPRQRRRIAAGRPVLLVDDVLTSGATLTACAEALLSSGSGEVCVITLARAARAD